MFQTVSDPNSKLHDKTLHDWKFLSSRILNIFIVLDDTYKEHSKTSRFLRKVLPKENVMVEEYERIHSSFKKDKRYEEEYKYIVAKIQVKLQLTPDEAENKISKTELASFHASGTISVNPESKEEKEENISMLNKPF